MVFVTGDCHGNFAKFRDSFFPEQKELTREDIVIVCGDFGLWHDNYEERNALDWLEKRSFTTVFVDGNHENFDRLYSDEFPVVDFHGGKAHRIREHVYHLMRGHVFEFDGRKFFCFGGASSHDVRDGILYREDFASDDEFCEAIYRMNRFGAMFRVNHMSWWKQELPTQEEMDFGKETLAKHGNRVDYIISHCCPQEIASQCSYYDPDVLTRWFNELAHTVSFDRWYFGHYHGNKQVMGKYVMLYEKIERVV